MKKILPSVLPALALLTLGGCAGTAALSTTEPDGVYYSSKDRTTQNARPAASTASAAEDLPAKGDDITNPDYSAQSGRSSSSATDDTEYYDDDYAYASRIRRFNQRAGRSFSYGYYDPFFTDPFWYGGPAYATYSPWGWGPGWGGGFYDPFWGPSWGPGWGWGSGVSINIGFGNPYWGWNRPWGWSRWGGGWGNGWNRWGGGWGGGFYDRYYTGVNNGWGGGGGTVRNVRYGPRNSRSSEATGSNRLGNSSAGTGRGRSSVATGGVASPDGTGNVNGATNGAMPSTGRGRVRIADTNPTGGLTETSDPGKLNQAGRSRDLIDEKSSEPQYGGGRLSRSRAVDADRTAGSGQETTSQPERAGRRWRTVEPTVDTDRPRLSTDEQPTRRSRTQELFGGGNNGGENQTLEQPTRRARSYEAPPQRERSYEAPQRSYEAPQRSYEAPQRSYEAPQRSYDAPSRSSGGDSGGGGRGGRGRVN